MLARTRRKARVAFFGLMCGTLALALALTQAAVPVVFGSATNYTIEGRPLAIAAGDLNHDGHIDLVTANFSSNSVSVLLGVGNGGFVVYTNYNVGAGPVYVVL